MFTILELHPLKNDKPPPHAQDSILQNFVELKCYRQRHNGRIMAKVTTILDWIPMIEYSSWSWLYVQLHNRVQNSGHQFSSHT